MQFEGDEESLPELTGALQACLAFDTGTHSSLRNPFLLFACSPCQFASLINGESKYLFALPLVPDGTMPLSMSLVVAHLSRYAFDRHPLVGTSWLAFLLSGLLLFPCPY